MLKKKQNIKKFLFIVYFIINFSFAFSIYAIEGMFSGDEDTDISEFSDEQNANNDIEGLESFYRHTFEIPTNGPLTKKQTKDHQKNIDNIQNKKNIDKVFEILHKKIDKSGNDEHISTLKTLEVKHDQRELRKIVRSYNMGEKKEENQLKVKNYTELEIKILHRIIELNRQEDALDGGGINDGKDWIAISRQIDKIKKKEIHKSENITKEQQKIFEEEIRKIDLKIIDQLISKINQSKNNPKYIEDPVKFIHDQAILKEAEKAKPLHETWQLTIALEGLFKPQKTNDPAKQKYLEAQEKYGTPKENNEKEDQPVLTLKLDKLGPISADQSNQTGSKGHLIVKSDQGTLEGFIKQEAAEKDKQDQKDTQTENKKIRDQAKQKRLQDIQTAQAQEDAAEKNKQTSPTTQLDLSNGESSSNNNSDINKNNNSNNNVTNKSLICYDVKDEKGAITEACYQDNKQNNLEQKSYNSFQNNSSNSTNTYNIVTNKNKITIMNILRSNRALSQ